MEVSMFTAYADLGMMSNNDLSFIHQLQVNSSLEELLSQPIHQPAYSNCSFDEFGGTNSSIQSPSNKRSAQTDLHHTLFLQKPVKQPKTNHRNNSYYEQVNHVLNSQDHYESNSTMLSFSDYSSNSSSQSSGLVIPKEEAVITTTTTTTNNNNNNVSCPSNEMVVNQASHDKQSYYTLEARPQMVANKKSSNFASMPQQSMDHILAERKRREKLSQRFIALSAIIPGLKKMDKASVLTDAIKYVKQMQERVKKLEEEAKKKTVESAVLLKRSYVSVAEISEGPFPEIEARFSDKDVLISIHCEKKKGVMEKLISQIEELHLVIVSSSSLAFGGSTLAVTIVAQMGAEFNMTATDLVRHLHATLK